MGNRRDATSDASQTSTIPHERPEPRPPTLSEPPPRKPLPSAIQQTLDSEERFWNLLTAGKAEDSTESPVRYAAYAQRIRTIMLSAHRYVAYTSEIGESFRPVAHKNWIRLAYGVSWAYLIGDVAHEGYKAYQANRRLLSGGEGQSGPAPTVAAGIAPIDHHYSRMAERAVFQSLASMGLPAVTVHSVVKYSGRAMKNVKSPKLRMWGPVGLGLAAVPALPYIFDVPVERATEFVFHKGFELVGGPRAVGKDPATGIKRKSAEKEKEL